MCMENFLTNVYFQKVLFSVWALIIMLLVSIVLKRGIDLVFHRVRNRITDEPLLARTRTIRSLLKNIMDVSLFIIILLIIMSQWGINIIPILTGAGIIGLAFSFGSQTLVKDLIAGFFIILEDQFSIGDMIQVDKYEGTVVNISLRLTMLRDKNGNMIYIPNSQINTVIRLVGKNAEKAAAKEVKK